MQFFFFGCLVWMGHAPEAAPLKFCFGENFNVYAVRVLVAPHGSL